ncbi:MAG: hypothetical protein DRJ42_06350 [Deltaproteobacteria bacterium]|nr:MAG: hypothetical protein DRJ42_06350 [Deltaproteobacteria bacterium]
MPAAEGNPPPDSSSTRSPTARHRRLDGPPRVSPAPHHEGRGQRVHRAAHGRLTRAEGRLVKAGYSASQMPYGYFLDLELTAPGHPLARVYKAW